jgi:hypothetical protein
VNHSLLTTLLLLSLTLNALPVAAATLPQTRYRTAQDRRLVDPLLTPELRLLDARVRKDPPVAEVLNDDRWKPSIHPVNLRKLELARGVRALAMRYYAVAEAVRRKTGVYPPAPLRKARTLLRYAVNVASSNDTQVYGACLNEAKFNLAVVHLDLGERETCRQLVEEVYNHASPEYQLHITTKAENLRASLDARR